jgi:hypothetical protein
VLTGPSALGSAEEECRCALKLGRGGLELMAAMCTSPVFSQGSIRRLCRYDPQRLLMILSAAPPALFQAGASYTLYRVLQTGVCPESWRLATLRALWRAIQDPVILSSFCTEVSARNRLHEAQCDIDASRLSGVRFPPRVRR